jgi:citrate synthase
MHSAITSAIGALKGPLHGGANEAVFHILEAIDASGADPVEYVKGMLAQKKKIPGFGHRVYHTEDPARHAPAGHVARPWELPAGRPSGLRSRTRLKNS